MKSRAYNREITRRKALNRRALDRRIYPYSDRDYYDNLHQYSKNKIHCSCPMCSSKTRNKRRRFRNSRGFAPSINYKISDRRKIETMDEDILETLGEHSPKKQSQSD